jgi:hypothetical protein
MTPRLRTGLAGVAFATVVGTGLAGPAQAAPPVSERLDCHEPAGSASAKGGRAGGDPDHRDVGAAEQEAIEERTAALLANRGGARPGQVEVPVYVHVMRDAEGNGDVTDAQIVQQVAVLDKTFAGEESPDAAETGFDFTLAGVERYDNTNWHFDRGSSSYRAETRRGGADALNIWLVDFAYLGIATFPWDYSNQGKVDGVRVLYSSLPGGTEANYNLGETATHEVGHWLGLYHTFQGGCEEKKGGDEVADTPAMSVPTNGCPEGKDSCVDQPGLDPIHNYMDYSYDSCYDQFSPDQAARMQDMWLAYRG